MFLNLKNAVGAIFKFYAQVLSKKHLPEIEIVVSLR